MEEFPQDICAELSGLDSYTLRNLGPLTGMAGLRHTLTVIGEPTPNPLTR